jgi:hypothetical protein
MMDRHSCGGFLVGSATQFLSLDPGLALHGLALPGLSAGSNCVRGDLPAEPATASTNRGSLADGYFRGAANGEVLTNVGIFIEYCKEKAPAYLVERDGF